MSTVFSGMRFIFRVYQVFSRFSMRRLHPMRHKHPYLMGQIWVEVVCRGLTWAIGKEQIVLATEVLAQDPTDAIRDPQSR